jgi:Na+-driven multidrug efflux pump
MNRDSIDFGTENIPEIFRKLLIPTLLGMLSSATLTIVDGVFVGHGVGSDGLAAVNIFAPLFSVSIGIGLMFGIGASVVAAIHLSQNRIKAARINISQALIVSCSIMLLISVLVMSFRKDVAYLLGSSSKLLPLVLDYMNWIVPFMVFQIIMSLGLFVIRLDGSPIYAMLCNVIPALINLVLCYLFVMRLGWGIKGSAIACSIGTILGGLLVMIYLLFFARTLHLYRLKMSRKSFVLTVRNIGYMLQLGFSAFFGEIAIAVMMLIGNYIFMGMLGEDGVAAFSVACYCFPLVFMVYNAISQSSQPIISFNYGCGNIVRVRKMMVLSVGTAVLCGLIALVATICFCKSLVALFLSTSCNAYHIAIDGMPYFALGFVFFAFNIACVGYYQSTGKAKRAAIYTLLRGGIFMTICFMILPLLLGVKGIWLAVPCSELLTAILIAGLYVFDSTIASRKSWH